MSSILISVSIHSDSNSDARGQYESPVLLILRLLITLFTGMRHNPVERRNPVPGNAVGDNDALPAGSRRIPPGLVATDTRTVPADRVLQAGINRPPKKTPPKRGFSVSRVPRIFALLVAATAGTRSRWAKELALQDTQVIDVDGAVSVQVRIRVSRIESGRHDSQV